MWSNGQDTRLPPRKAGFDSRCNFLLLYDKKKNYIVENKVSIFTFRRNTSIENIFLDHFGTLFIGKAI